MKNLNSVLKIKHDTFPKNVCIVPQPPVVMYGCENWTIKKAECQKLMLSNCGAGEDYQESLG